VHIGKSSMGVYSKKYSILTRTVFSEIPFKFFELRFSVSRYNLRINGLLRIDAGIFQCIGTNPAGSVQASARLTINQPSEFLLGDEISDNNLSVLILLIFINR